MIAVRGRARRVLLRLGLVEEALDVDALLAPYMRARTHSPRDTTCRHGDGLWLVPAFLDGRVVCVQCGLELAQD